MKTFKEYLIESDNIKKLYTDAGLKAPDGKGIHTVAFHKMAIAIKKDNPKIDMNGAYAIAMKKLGKEKAVKVDHRQE